MASANGKGRRPVVMSEKAAWLRDAARPPLQNPFADSLLQEQFLAEEVGGVPALGWRPVPGGPATLVLLSNAQPGAAWMGGAGPNVPHALTRTVVVPEAPQPASLLRDLWRAWRLKLIRHDRRARDNWLRTHD